MDNQQEIKIYLKSYDVKLLERSVESIVNTVKRSGVKCMVHLQKKLKKMFTVLISPHVNKHARDQYELVTHRRAVTIVAPSESTVNALMKLDLASGINIRIKLDSEKKK